MPLTFSKPQLMTWNGTIVTDHNRSPLSVDVERIERVSRMANGTLRKYVIADKRTFSMSWENVPSKATFTVDGGWGANEIETFYNNNKGAVTLVLRFSDGSTETYTVVLTEFSKELSGRGRYDMYNVNVTLEEV